MRGKNLRRAEGFVLLLLLAGAAMVVAQAPQGGVVVRGPYQQTMAPTGTGQRTVSQTVSDRTADPVAQVRNDRSWEYGPFVNWGTGVGDRSNYKFFWGGFELAKVLTPVMHAGIFSGQFEFGGKHHAAVAGVHAAAASSRLTPAKRRRGSSITCDLPYGGGTFHGVSLTPVIFRWNFLTKSRRIQPWFQAAGGLIYTTHKFPPNIMSNNNPANGPMSTAARACGTSRRRAEAECTTSCGRSGRSIWA